MPSLDLLNAIPTLKDGYFRRLSIKAGKLGHIGETAASPANCQERATKLFDHEWQHLSCRQPAFRCGEKVRRPCVECGAFLLCPIVPLINPDYASSASAQMVQHRLGDFEAHAEALQPCREGSAQVTQPPAAHGTPAPHQPRLRNQILVMPPPPNAVHFFIPDTDCPYKITINRIYYQRVRSGRFGAPD